LSVIVRKFPFLSRLTLKFCFGLLSLDPLCVLPHLYHLDISGCPKVLLPANLGPSLRSVKVFCLLFILVLVFNNKKAEFCDSLTDLSALPLGLESLDIGSLKRLAPEPALSFVRRLQGLRHLRLQMTEFFLRDSFLVSLCEACGPCLQEMQLSPCLIGTEGLLAIGTHCSRLELCHLPGTWCEALDEALCSLAVGCKALRSLSLGKQERATDAAFVALAALPQMELLDLNLHSLSSQALFDAAFHDCLKCLSLRYCKNVNGEALLSLARCKSLQSLDVSHTTLKFDDIFNLAHGTPALNFVNVTGLNISVFQTNQFRQRFPRIQLYA
jgi:hypothetical protein